MTLPHAHARLSAARVSVAVGVALFAAKTVAYAITGSMTVLSDALESIVNIVAAGTALGAVRFALRPADRDHPYGHGKMESLSAAFEGGLITLAALVILYEGIRGLVFGVELRSITIGLAVVAGAALANLALGLWLVRQGRRLDSAALVADGQHVLSDFVTTAAAIASLGLVHLTGLTALDPLFAIGAGLFLGWTGIKLIRRAMATLLDAEDPALLAQFVSTYNTRKAGRALVGLHRLRAQRHGSVVHADAHIYAPFYWELRRAHDEAKSLAEELEEALAAKVVFHLDPCRPTLCRLCPLADCGHRTRSPDVVDFEVDVSRAVGGPEGYDVLNDLSEPPLPG